MASKQPRKQPEALSRDVTIKGVECLNKELEYGAYGRVFTVQYRGIVWAAKEIRPKLGKTVKNEKAIIENILRECRQRNTICHPNVVKFEGVYFPPRTDCSFPIMVIEMMNTTLTSFIKANRSKISSKTKISILYDVSFGLSYLHSREPVVIHKYLSSNTIMLTSHLVAKITDFGVNMLILADNEQTMSRLTAPGTVDFMPPETFEANPRCNTAVDVFSFAAIALHVFAEEWPKPCGQKRRDPATRKFVAVTEVERRQNYLNKIPDGATMLTKLLERCLDDYFEVRPSIQEVVEVMKTLKVNNYT